MGGVGRVLVVRVAVGLVLLPWADGASVPRALRGSCPVLAVCPCLRVPVLSPSVLVRACPVPFRLRAFYLFVCLTGACAACAPPDRR